MATESTQSQEKCQSH